MSSSAAAACATDVSASARSTVRPWGLLRRPDGKHDYSSRHVVRLRSALQPSPARESPDLWHRAVAHHRRQLLRHALRQWHYASLCARLRRLRDLCVARVRERALLRHCWANWRRLCARRQALSRFCSEVRRRRLTRIEDIWQLCQQVRVHGGGGAGGAGGDAGEHFEYRTALLVCSVRMGQLYLCRRMWERWREAVGRQRAQRKSDATATLAGQVQVGSL